MTSSRSTKALKYLASSLLLMGVVEACSADDSATPNPFTSPPTLEIASISLGTGSIGQGGDSSVLACDNTIGVTLALTNWLPYPLGKCGSTPQCGQIRVSLLGGTGGTLELTSQTFAAVGVNLNVARLVESGVVKSGSYTIHAELVDDAGHVYPVTDGGNNSADRAFKLNLADGCATSGAAGAAGEGGMGGAPPFEAGGSGGLDRAGAGGTPSP